MKCGGDSHMLRLVAPTGRLRRGDEKLAAPTTTGLAPYGRSHGMWT